MHPNPAFRKQSAAQNLDFARARGFGALTVNGPEGPLLAHIPFEVSPDGAHLTFHLARSNPIIQNGLPQMGVMAVMGPDAYISPDWYGAADQVPTWNYIAVHLRGMILPLPADALAPHLDAVSDAFEARLAPKPMWKTTKMSDGVMERMMRMILPFRMEISDIQGTWKLGQNRTPEARAGAIDGLRGLGGVSADVAQLMEDAAKDEGQ